MKKTLELMNKADELESMGLLRRAISVWREIQSISDGDMKSTAIMKQRKLTTLLSSRLKDAERNQYNCRKNINEDRETILQHLKNGKTPREIEMLTWRSTSFIYSCKKKLQES